MKLKFSLKQTWTALILFAVIAPVTIVMSWYGQQLYKDRLSNALQIERQANESLRYKIDAEVKRLKTVFKNESDPLSLFINKINNPDALKDINTLLGILVEREQVVRNAMIVSMQGDVIAAFDSNIGITGDIILSIKELQLVASHWGFDNPYKSPEVVIPSLGRVYIGSPKKHDDFFAFTMAIPISTPTEAVLIAIIDVDKLWLADTYKVHGIGKEKTRDYILDRRGSLITKIEDSNSKPGDLMTHMSIVRTALIDGEWPSDTSYIGVINQPVFGTITTIPSLNWTLVSEVIASKITQPIWDSLIRIILMTLFGIYIFVWFVLYLAHKTLKPIHSACEAIDHVAKGEYQYVLEPCGIHEFDAMAMGVNDMAEARQKTEAELIAAKQEAERANQAKSEFLSRMSHELRTPMNAILGFGQILELDAEGFNETQRDNIKEILDAGYHLLDLINEVLDLSKIESGKLEISMEEVSVDDVLKQCIALIGLQAEARQVKIIDHVSRKGYTVQADFTRFKQILLNLLSNAVKYGQDHSQITLDSETIANQRLRIRITDTGEGLTEEDITKLFTSFERLNVVNNVEGTGIGLVITKHLVELMGGAIGVESTLGEGCTFWIELELSGDA